MKNLTDLSVNPLQDFWCAYSKYIRYLDTFVYCMICLINT